jgi:hypothetical protein
MGGRHGSWGAGMRNVFDRIALAYIRRRLAHFQKLGDVHDKFADSVATLLSAEIERRHVLLAGWDAGIRACQQALAERELRAAAIEQFQSLEPEQLHYLH